MTAQETAENLRTLYREYFNDFLTVERFAEHHGLDYTDALHLITTGRHLHDREAGRLKQRTEKAIG